MGLRHGESVSAEDRRQRTVEALAPWFHNLHLPGGVQTAPRHALGDFPAFKWREIADGWPHDLSGWRALDVGCNAGFYSFELAKRGAHVLGIDRELYECQECDETFIRELNAPDSPLQRAVKCVGCGNMIPQVSARILYQRDDYAHFIGECCWDERLRE